MIFFFFNISLNYVSVRRYTRDVYNEFINTVAQVMTV